MKSSRLMHRINAYYICTNSGADNSSHFPLEHRQTETWLSECPTLRRWLYNMPSVLWRCWLGGRKSIQPVKKYGVMRGWHGYLSGGRCKWFAYGPADAIATPSSLASAKSRMVLVYPSGNGLPRLSWKKAVKWLCVCARPRLYSRRG